MWISSAVVPLVQFADCVRPLSSTQLDLAGLDFEFPVPLANRLREFDEVVSWYGSNRQEFRAAMTAVQPRCTFLAALPEASWCHPAADFFAQQVGAKAGLVPRIRVAGQVRRSVVIHPFSGSAKKNWPIENYRALAERLPMPVEWVAGPEESLRDANRLDNLLVLASWMRGCELYIGNDSGISHLAAAIGLPAVVLFGPTDPNVWAPQGDAVQILQHNPLSALAVDPVLAAAGYLSL